MQKNSGFSLIELAISLTIIALLAGTVVAGNALIKNSVLLNSIKEMQTNLAAIKGFKEQYTYWPGDLPNATSLWPGTANGNGNEKIYHDVAPLNEIYLVWQHLALADYIKGNYTGTGTTGTPGVNLPASAHNPQMDGYMFNFEGKMSDAGYAWNYAGPNSDGFYLRLASIYTNNPLLTGALTAAEAYKMDTKIDDSNPSTGIILGLPGAGAAGSCRVGTYPSATYALNVSTPDCQLLYRIDSTNK